MQLIPITFPVHERINLLITRLLKKKKYHASPEEIIAHMANQLIVADNGCTYLLDDISQATECEITNPGLTFTSYRGTRLTLWGAKMDPQELIRNKPLARVLYQIYSTPADKKPMQFALPAEPGAVTVDPWIMFDEQSIEEHMAPKTRSFPNYALYELLWMRFEHYEKSLYDTDKLAAEVDSRRSAVATIQKFNDANLQTACKELTRAEGIVNAHPEYKGKSPQQLNELGETLEKKKSRYAVLSKALPIIAGVLIFAAVAAFPLLPIVLSAVAASAAAISIASLAASIIGVSMVTAASISYPATIAAHKGITGYFQSKIQNATQQLDGLRQFCSAQPQRNYFQQEKRKLEDNARSYNDRLRTLDQVKSKLLVDDSKVLSSTELSSRRRPGPIPDVLLSVISNGSRPSPG